MRKEIEDHWRLIKNSYPSAVVFYECDGLFFVRENDIEARAKDFGVAFTGSWVGFDSPIAVKHMHDLVAQGAEVLRASPNSVTVVEPPRDRSKEIERERRESTFIAIDPTMLFSAEALRAYPVSAESFGEMCRRIHSANGSAPNEFGDIFVFEVDGWHEIDRELTSMPISRVVLVAKAAYTLGVRVPCRLVLPRAWRRRRRKRDIKGTKSEVDLPIGQLKLAGFD